jgi:ankyrin repeat protein
MIKELGADVDEARQDGTTSQAAQNGNFAVVRCLVTELGADVNRAKHDGAAPLMAAVYQKQENVIAFLLKYGADPQLSAPAYGTAAEISKIWECQSSTRSTSMLGRTARCPVAVEREP